MMNAAVANAIRRVYLHLGSILTRKQRGAVCFDRHIVKATRRDAESASASRHRPSPLAIFALPSHPRSFPFEGTFRRYLNSPSAAAAAKTAFPSTRRANSDPRVREIPAAEIIRDSANYDDALNIARHRPAVVKRRYRAVDTARASICPGASVRPFIAACAATSK